jgi:hypothetical protein
MSRPACLLVLLPGLCLAGGCRKAPGRHEVTGKVLLRGEPLAEGVIDFEPLEGQPSKSGASILNGSYRIPRDRGLAPGRYRVSIVAGDGTVAAGVGEPSAAPRATAPGGERVPPEYNVRSKLVREVKAGKNALDFDIP